MLVIFLLGAGRGKVRGGAEVVEGVELVEEGSDIGSPPSSPLSPLSAALALTRLLENSPYTNAGTGSELNQAAQIECDASIVLEPRRKTASVAAVQGVKNPISICHKLLHEIVHQTAALPSYPCFLAGQGAHDYAAAQGLELGSLETPRARHAYEHWSNELGLQLPATDTVGVVALSKNEICACSSSGGPILKVPGRVGPAAVVGAACDAGPGRACIASGFGEDMLNYRLCARALDGDLESLAESMRAQCSLQREPYFGIIRAEVRGDFVYVESYQTTEYMTWGYKNLETGQSKVLCTAGAGASKGLRLKF